MASITTLFYLDLWNGYKAYKWALGNAGKAAADRGTHKASPPPVGSTGMAPELPFQIEDHIIPLREGTTDFGVANGYTEVQEFQIKL